MVIIECKKLSYSGVYYNTDSNCAFELSTIISYRVDACGIKSDCSNLFGILFTS